MQALYSIDYLFRSFACDPDVSLKIVINFWANAKLDVTLPTAFVAICKSSLVDNRILVNGQRGYMMHV